MTMAAGKDEDTDTVGAGAGAPDTTTTNNKDIDNATANDGTNEDVGEGAIRKLMDQIDQIL